MESIKPPPLGEQLARLIRDGIIQGEFPPGTTFLQEDLAERYGVSRIPVREALQILMREGLVVVQPNRRVIVATLTEEEIADDYSVRALVEAEAARRAAGLEHRDVSVQAVRRAHEQAAEAHEAGDVIQLLEAFRNFHRAIWEASGSRQLVTLAQQLWTGLAPQTPAFLPQQYDKSTEEHARIIDALVAGDPNAARDVMTTHILRTCSDLLAYRKQAADASTTERVSEQTG